MSDNVQWLIFHYGKCILFSVLLDSEERSLWDLWALDWIQQRAECLRFCVGRSIPLVGQLPVSADIEYEFSHRNPYNYLQVTYYKVSCSSRSHGGQRNSVCHYLSSLPIDMRIKLSQSGIKRRAA